jgi:hypothetical protein
MSGGSGVAMASVNAKCRHRKTLRRRSSPAAPPVALATRVASPRGAPRGSRVVERDSFVCFLAEGCLRAVVERGTAARMSLRLRSSRWVVSRLACSRHYGGAAAPTIRGGFVLLRRLRAAEDGTVVPSGTIVEAGACPDVCVSRTHFGAEGRRTGTAEASGAHARRESRWQ